MAFCLVVSLLPLQPSAVALPNSQPVGSSGEASRVVPIFNSANSQQAVMTGYLYSSKIVFAVVPVSGSSNFYVGLPKSLASTTGGRVKVAEVFASQGTPAMIDNYSFAFNRFAVFVLEKDLIAVNPAQLLTEEMDTGKDFPKIATAYSYGEYENRTFPGSLKPCEGGPCSKDVRSLQLRILALKGKPPVSVMPNFPDQFKGQIILENSVDPKAGIACYGDGGAPVLTGYRNQELYMGAIADQFYVKACGAYPQATYDKDGKMTKFGYDTDLAISFISPVYKHMPLIKEALKFAGVKDEIIRVPSSTPSSSAQSISIKKCPGTYKKRESFTSILTKSKVTLTWVAQPGEIQYQFITGQFIYPGDVDKWKKNNFREGVSVICRVENQQGLGIVVGYHRDTKSNLQASALVNNERKIPIRQTTLEYDDKSDIILIFALSDNGSTSDYELLQQYSDRRFSDKVLCNDLGPGLWAASKSLLKLDKMALTGLSYVPGPAGKAAALGLLSIEGVEMALDPSVGNATGLITGAVSMELTAKSTLKPGDELKLWTDNRDSFKFKNPKSKSFTKTNGKPFKMILAKNQNNIKKLKNFQAAGKAGFIVFDIIMAPVDVYNFGVGLGQFVNDYSGPEAEEFRKNCAAAYG